MSPLTRVGPAAVLVAVGLVAAVVPPAQADSTKVEDETRDVTAFTIGASPETQTEAAPEETLADVRSTRWSYRPGKLVVVVSFVDSDPEVPVQAQVRVRGGGEDINFRRVQGGRVNGDRRVPKGSPVDDRRCVGGVATRNFRTDTFRIEIPARCFGAPARVRTGVAAGRSVSTDGDDPTTYWIDSATGPRVQSLGRYGKPRLSVTLDKG